MTATRGGGRPWPGGASRMTASQSSTIVNVGGALRVSTSTETWHESIPSMRASLLVTFTPTCDGWVTPGFDSAPTAGHDVRRIETGRAPLVTRSRVACSGVSGDRRPELPTLGERFAAERPIGRGFEIVDRDSPALAADRSIPAPVSTEVKAEIGRRPGLERRARQGEHAAWRIAPEQPAARAGRHADTTENTGTPRSTPSKAHRARGASRQRGSAMGRCAAAGQREPAMRERRTDSAQGLGGSTCGEQRLNLENESFRERGPLMFDSAMSTR
jgi:hypothetical protein